VVDDHVLRATGSTAGYWAGHVVWDSVHDATDWTEGVGCTLGACADGWAVLAGTLEAGYVASTRFIHLFLFKADGRTSLE
jgi:hypothetical protein